MKSGADKLSERDLEQQKDFIELKTLCFRLYSVKFGVKILADFLITVNAFI